jgi:hypothetical protein
MLGSYGGGALWEEAGPSVVFSVAAGASVLAWLLIFLWVEKAR